VCQVFYKGIRSGWITLVNDRLTKKKDDGDVGSAYETAKEHTDTKQLLVGYSQHPCDAKTEASL